MGGEIREIYPVILTSTFEGDYERWGAGEFSKISAFELKMILSGFGKMLLNPFIEPLTIATGSRQFAEDLLRKLVREPNDDSTLHQMIRLVDIQKSFMSSVMTMQINNVWRQLYIYWSSTIFL